MGTTTPGANMNGIDDAALLRRFHGERSEEAFRQLLERYSGMVYATCLRRLGGDASSAEDATQAVFLVLMSKAGGIPGRVARHELRERSLGAWLFQTARSVVAHMKREAERRRRREVAAAERKKRVMDEEAQEARRREGLRAHLDEAVDALRPRQRDAVVLCYLQGRTQKETALRLGCSERAVGHRVRCALDKLRAYLSKKGVVLPVAALTSFLTAEAARAAPAGLVTACHAVAMEAMKGTAIASSGPMTIAKGAMKMMFWMKLKTAVISTVLAVALVSSGAAAFWIIPLAAPQVVAESSSDWPQLQHDPQRTGHTLACPEPPWEPAWQVSFPPEYIHLVVQPVVADGRVYVGTKSGKMRALDRNTGKVLWTFDGAGPILHTAAYAGDRVFFGSVNGVAGDKVIPGAVYAVNARSGGLLWKTPARKGFSTAPLVVERHVYIGGRNGTLYALSQESGKITWSFDAGAPILQTAAYVEPKGRRPGLVVFGSEDIIVYALEARTGKLFWKSAQIPGESFKNNHPVVDGEKIILRPMITTPKYPPTIIGEDLEKAFQEGRYPRVPQKYFDKFEKRFREDPYAGGTFVLDAATGKEAFVAMFPRPGSLTGEMAPVALDGRGNWLSSAMGGPKTWQSIVRIDSETGRPKDLIWDPKSRTANSDENENVSVGGHLLFIVHPDQLAGHGCCGHSVVYNLDKPGILYFSGKFPKPARPIPAPMSQAGGHAMSITEDMFFRINYQGLISAWRSAKR